VYKTSTLYEVYLYVVHGMLHLAGQKDTTPRLRLAMEQGARRILTHVYP
jgi:ssRNA-specific RNase YbeY (16S rRNA maturation enzyme)